MGCLCGVLWSFSLRGQIVVDAKTADHVHALTSVKLVKAADTTSHSSVHLTVFLFVCLHLSPSVSVVCVLPEYTNFPIYFHFRVLSSGFTHSQNFCFLWIDPRCVFSRSLVHWIHYFPWSQCFIQAHLGGGNFPPKLRIFPPRTWGEVCYYVNVIPVSLLSAQN